MIVKHRRGTTKEWRENNIIPEAGELVIEECDDGTRRAKFGTGYQYFSDLPYIDEKLWEEIESTKTDLNNKITKIDDRLLDELEEAKNTLEKQIIAEKTVREKAIADLVQSAMTSDTQLRKEAAERDVELRKEIEATSEELHSLIDGFGGKATVGINSLGAQLSSIESVFNGKLINHTTLFDKKLDELADDVVEDYTNKITKLSEDLQATSKELTDLAAQVDNNKDLVVDSYRDANNKINSVKTAIAAQAKRIDNILALPDGSTTADAELKDIRVGHNDIYYESAGAAVRAVGTEVQELRDSLSQYIGTQAINGLHYDIEGNVGLGAPYMLYLTANGEVLQDTGVQIIGGAGGGPGGGSTTSSELKISYITKDAIKITSPEEATLSFLFSGTDAAGDNISQADAQWKVNGTVVARGTVKSGENSFDASAYVRENDTIKVLLLVTDDNGSVATKTWSIQHIALNIASDFNAKKTWPVGEEIPFSYKVEGALKKTAVFKLNGEEIGRQVLEANISGFDRDITFPIPAYDKNNKLREQGSYLLEAYLEADFNGDIITSKTRVIKDLLWYDSTNVEGIPVIGVTSQHMVTKQYSAAEIMFTVYDPRTSAPKVDIEVDGAIVSSLVIEPNPAYEYTPTDVYSYITDQVGTHKVKIICGKSEKVITVVVESLNIDITPVTTGLVFDFHPVGVSNNDTDKRLWSQGDIHMTVSHNFDWKNGGYQTEKDENGNSIPGTEHFCIKAGSTATIDYKLFANDAKVYGKECKLVFKTKHVTNPEAIFLSCIDNKTDKDHIGIQMGAHQANIYGQSGNLELAYSEEDIIEFEFNISKSNEAVPMVMGYEDGVPSRPMVYDSTYKFKQDDPKEITLGSPDCDLLIYRFKVYNTSLSASDILDNFILDARTSDEMISRYNRNLIYSKNGELAKNGTLDPDLLAQACPWLRVYKLSAPHFTNNKSDKVKNTKIQQLYKNGDPVLDNWICYNAQHSGQGTSSNNYGASGRNLDFIMNKDGAYFELGDGTTASKITLTRESVPVAYLNAKVNIASSNNLTNALLANRYNRFNPYRRPFVEREGINTDFIKDTMEFHNCVIFIQETDPDFSTHREFADNNWHFYAIGNIGDSKKTDNTRATDPDDKYECCVEIMDVGLPLSDFPRETIREAMAYDEDATTGERVYKWATDKNLKNGILLEKNAEGNYIPATGEKVDVENKTYYMDFLLNDDFSEDYTYGWRYLWEDGTDEENEEVFNYCKQKWIDLYRFITRDLTTNGVEDEEKVNAWKEEFSNWFVLDSALYYYLFTTRYCMVDNRAKNTFWHYGKAADGTYKWDLCWDYDNDTSLGLNNFGKQVYRYGLEDIDRDADKKEIFRESDSTFFCRIRDCFASELKTMYNTLESQNAWHAESFIKECDNWQNEFPEELWRLDINRKYIRTYNSSFINGKGDEQFLVNMCNGKMKYHRRQWERNQEVYMASKYQTPLALDAGLGAANIRVNQFDSTDGMVVIPNYQLTLTPCSYMYLNIQYGGTSPVQVRVTDANINKPIPVPFSGTLSADIINIGSASAIRDFGDLSAVYPETVSVQNATRLKTLTLGNAITGYSNAPFTSPKFEENPLLEEINLTNITGATKSLNLEKLLNLKKLYASGTNIPGVSFADGGKLEYVELPAVNNITFKNLIYLSSDNFKLNPDSEGNNNYDSVVDLTIENCPLIDAVAIFNSCKNLVRARLVGIDFGSVTYDYFSSKLFKLKGLTANGEESPNVALRGKAKFDYLTGEQYNDIRQKYPDLIIDYDYLVSKLIFANADGTILTDLEQTLENGANGQAPAFESIKEATAQYSYAHVGWSTTPNILIVDNEAFDEEFYNKEAFEKVEGDRILYPIFRATTRTYEVTFKSYDQILATLSVPYEQNAGTYYLNSGYETPKYNASSAIDRLYEFTGWYGKLGATTDITEELLKCYDDEPITFEAQFTLPDQDRDPDGTPDSDDLPGYTLGLGDISYTIGSNNTLTITSCDNIFNTIVKVPEKLTKEGKEYTVTGIGGFSDCANLALIYLPATLKTVKEETFADCSKLLEVDMRDCENISLLNKVFYKCHSLSNVLLPNKGLTTIRNGCFKDCFALSNIELPSTLTTIGTYSFNGSGLVTVSIPDSVTSLSEHAFGEMPKLTEVIFADRTSKLPTIHHKAFEASGVVSFEVPWSLNEHLSDYTGTYKDVRGNELNKDIFFGTAVNSTITFKDGTVITKEHEIEDGNRFKEAE